jgi:hypothetical protein
MAKALLRARQAGQQRERADGRCYSQRLETETAPHRELGHREDHSGDAAGGQGGGADQGHAAAENAGAVARDVPLHRPEGELGAQQQSGCIDGREAVDGLAVDEEEAGVLRAQQDESPQEEAGPAACQRGRQQRRRSDSERGDERAEMVDPRRQRDCERRQDEQRCGRCG